MTVVKNILLSLALAGCLTAANAQQGRLIVRFRDKGATTFSLRDPGPYLAQRSIERRQRHAIATDSTDLPVPSAYLDSIRLAGNVTLLNVSRWLNQVSIQTSDSAALARISRLPFVAGVRSIAARSRTTTLAPADKFAQPGERVRSEAGATAGDAAYGNALPQLRIHKGTFLHGIGLRGQGMVIGMLDAGFQNYTGLRAFDSVRINGQVLGTWDFVNREAGVTEDHAHGMQCFSTIAANIPGQFIGTAPKAAFYLFRTEDPSSEYPIEEHNWVCGAERIDSAGGDVISSSLGYTAFDDPSLSHTYADLDGNTTMAAIGADLAAKKGLLVLNSAGNDGNKPWHYLATPADADSILAVGAVDTTGQVAPFSAYGPAADGRVKPDVVSVGVATVVQFANNTIGPNNGTSFACPNMAGLATCLWQGFPEFNNMKIIDALRRSASRYNNPDDRIGYGIPDVKQALLRLVKDFSTATATIDGCKATISWQSKDMQAMRYEIERKAPGETAYTRIGQQGGTGSVFSTHAYQFTDSLLQGAPGNVSYRIRQVVDTASAQFAADYIDTVQVATASACLVTGLNPADRSQAIYLYPNPGTTSFILQIDEEAVIKNLLITLVSANGQMVLKLQRAKGVGRAAFTLPISRLAAGKYFVIVQDGTRHLATRPLVKL